MVAGILFLQSKYRKAHNISSQIVSNQDTVTKTATKAIKADIIEFYNNTRKTKWPSTIDELQGTITTPFSLLLSFR